MLRGALHKAGMLTLLAAVLCATAASSISSRPQIVVDRIVARIEGEVLLLSDLRELAQFQQLLGDKPEPESKRLDELIDQWIIEHEAEAALFSQPSDADVSAEVQQLQKDLGDAHAFQARLAELQLSPIAVRRQVKRELFFTRYLEYKFRPAAQVDAAAEQKYYDTEFAPQMTARGEKVPPLDSVRAQIHELLVQKDISTRADEWLTESRKRLKIEIVEPSAAGKNGLEKQ
jgi:hypothetical protein